jgi:phosphatidylglycerol---prolipoprotein diacylglyceryl transferase
MEYNISPFIIQFSDTIGIRWYSLMYILGFAITYYWLTRVENYDKDKVSDLAFYGLLSAIVGGRIGFLLFYRPDLLTSFTDAIAIWNGGLSFHGGLIAVLIFLYYFTKKHHLALKKSSPKEHSTLEIQHSTFIQNSSFKIHHSALLDLFDSMIAPTALFLFFGRIGNFLNNELWGNITTVAWCFKTEGLEGCRHPSQLYEALYNIALFLMLIMLSKYSPLYRGDVAQKQQNKKYSVSQQKKECLEYNSATEGSGRQPWIQRRGAKSALFLIWYGTFRSLTELFWRVPDWTWNGITAGQMLSVPMIIAGIILLKKSLRKDVPSLTRFSHSN